MVFQFTCVATGLVSFGGRIRGWCFLKSRVQTHPWARVGFPSTPLARDEDVHELQGRVLRTSKSLSRAQPRGVRLHRAAGLAGGAVPS